MARRNQNKEEFWKSMLDKYENRNAKLQNQQNELLKRLDEMECRMTTRKADLMNYSAGKSGGGKKGPPPCDCGVVCKCSSCEPGRGKSCKCADCDQSLAECTCAGGSGKAAAKSLKDCKCSICDMPPSECTCGGADGKAIKPSKDCKCSICDKPPNECTCGGAVAKMAKPQKDCKCSICDMPQNECTCGGAGGKAAVKSPKDCKCSICDMPQDECTCGNTGGKAAKPDKPPACTQCEDCQPDACDDEGNAIPCICVDPASADADANSIFSLNSADLLFMTKLNEIVTREKQMKMKVQELEHRERAYMDTLRQADEMWACLESCYKQKLSDVQQSGDSERMKYDKMSDQLMDENQRLKDQIKDIQLDLKQAMERIQGPLSRQLDHEKRRCSQLENDLNYAAQCMQNKQGAYSKNMNKLQNQLDCTCKDLCGIRSDNEQLKKDLCHLRCQYEELQQDLIDQKINEARTLERINETLKLRGPCDCGQGKKEKECKDYTLNEIARNLSRTLVDINECMQCQENVPKDLKETVEGIKVIVDLVDSRGKSGGGRRGDSPGGGPGGNNPPGGNDDGCECDDPDDNGGGAKPDGGGAGPKAEDDNCPGPDDSPKSKDDGGAPNDADLPDGGGGGGGNTDDDAVDINITTNVEVDAPVESSTKVSIQNDAEQVSAQALENQEEETTENQADDNIAPKTSGKKKCSEQICDKPSCPLRLTAQPTLPPCMKVSSMGQENLPSEADDGNIEVFTVVDSPSGADLEVETEVTLHESISDGINITTAVTGSGILEVVTEGPSGSIETKITYSEDGEIQITTEVKSYNGEEALAVTYPFGSTNLETCPKFCSSRKSTKPYQLQVPNTEEVSTLKKFPPCLVPLKTPSKAAMGDGIDKTFTKEKFLNKICSKISNKESGCVVSNKSLGIKRHSVKYPTEDAKILHSKSCSVGVSSVDLPPCGKTFGKIIDVHPSHSQESDESENVETTDEETQIDSTKIPCKDICTKPCRLLQTSEVLALPVKELPPHQISKKVSIQVSPSQTSLNKSIETLSSFMIKPNQAPSSPCQTYLKKPSKSLSFQMSMKKSSEALPNQTSLNKSIETLPCPVNKSNQASPPCRTSSKKFIEAPPCQFTVEKSGKTSSSQISLKKTNETSTSQFSLNRSSESPPCLICSRRSSKAPSSQICLSKSSTTDRVSRASKEPSKELIRATRYVEITTEIIDETGHDSFTAVYPIGDAENMAAESCGYIRSINAQDIPTEGLPPCEKLMLTPDETLPSQTSSKKLFESLTKTGYAEIITEMPEEELSISVDNKSICTEPCTETCQIYKTSENLNFSTKELPPCMMLLKNSDKKLTSQISLHKSSQTSLSQISLKRSSKIQSSQLSLKKSSQSEISQVSLKKSSQAQASQVSLKKSSQAQVSQFSLKKSSHMQVSQVALKNSNFTSCDLKKPPCMKVSRESFKSIQPLSETYIVAEEGLAETVMSREIETEEAVEIAITNEISIQAPGHIDIVSETAVALKESLNNVTPEEDLFDDAEPVREFSKVSFKEGVVDDHTEDLEKEVNEALHKANEEVMEALEQANKEVTEALEKANEDMETALSLALIKSKERIETARDDLYLEVEVKVDCETPTKPHYATPKASFTTSPESAPSEATSIALKESKQKCIDISKIKETSEIEKGLCQDVCAKLANAKLREEIPEVTEYSLDENSELTVIVEETHVPESASTADKTFTTITVTSEVTISETLSERESTSGYQNGPTTTAGTEFIMEELGESQDDNEEFSPPELVSDELSAVNDDPLDRSVTQSSVMEEPVATMVIVGKACTRGKPCTPDKSEKANYVEKLPKPFKETSVSTVASATLTVKVTESSIEELNALKGDDNEPGLLPVDLDSNNPMVVENQTIVKKPTTQATTEEKPSKLVVSEEKLCKRGERSSAVKSTQLPEKELEITREASVSTVSSVKATTTTAEFIMEDQSDLKTSDYEEFKLPELSKDESTIVKEQALHRTVEKESVTATEKPCPREELCKYKKPVELTKKVSKLKDEANDAIIFEKQIPDGDEIVQTTAEENSIALVSKEKKCKRGKLSGLMKTTQFPEKVLELTREASVSTVSSAKASTTTTTEFIMEDLSEFKAGDEEFKPPELVKDKPIAVEEQPSNITDKMEKPCPREEQCKHKKSMFLPEKLSTLTKEKDSSVSNISNSDETTTTSKVAVEEQNEPKSEILNRPILISDKPIDAQETAQTITKKDDFIAAMVTKETLCACEEVVQLPKKKSNLPEKFSTTVLSENEGKEGKVKLDNTQSAENLDSFIEAGDTTMEFSKLISIADMNSELAERPASVPVGSVTGRFSTSPARRPLTQPSERLEKRPVCDCKKCDCIVCSPDIMLKKQQQIGDVEHPTNCDCIICSTDSTLKKSQKVGDVEHPADCDCLDCLCDSCTTSFEKKSEISCDTLDCNCINCLCEPKTNETPKLINPQDSLCICVSNGNEMEELKYDSLCICQSGMREEKTDSLCVCKPDEGEEMRPCEKQITDSEKVYSSSSMMRAEHLVLLKEQELPIEPNLTDDLIKKFPKDRTNYKACVCPKPQSAKASQETTRLREIKETVAHMSDNYLFNQLEDIEVANLNEKKKMTELQDVVRQIECACREAELGTKPRNRDPKLYETTLQGLRSTLTEMQSKCNQKDLLIITMIQELKSRTNSQVLNGMLKKLSTSCNLINAKSIELCNSMPQKRSEEISPKVAEKKSSSIKQFTKPSSRRNSRASPTGQSPASSRQGSTSSTRPSKNSIAPCKVKPITSSTHKAKLSNKKMSPCRSKTSIKADSKLKLKSTSKPIICPCHRELKPSCTINLQPSEKVLIEQSREVVQDLPRKSRTKECNYKNYQKKQRTHECRCDLKSEYVQKDIPLFVRQDSSQELSITGELSVQEETKNCRYPGRAKSSNISELDSQDKNLPFQEMCPFRTTEGSARHPTMVVETAYSINQKSLRSLDWDKYSSTGSYGTTKTNQNLGAIKKRNVKDVPILEITEVRKISPDSLLVKWSSPTEKNIIGYEVFVDGFLKSRILNGARTSTILHTLALKSAANIAIHPISPNGRCQPPARALFQI